MLHPGNEVPACLPFHVDVHVDSVHDDSVHFYSVHDDSAKMIVRKKVACLLSAAAVACLLSFAGFVSSQEKTTKKKGPPRRSGGLGFSGHALVKGLRASKGCLGVDSGSWLQR